MDSTLAITMIWAGEGMIDPHVGAEPDTAFGSQSRSSNPRACFAVPSWYSELRCYPARAEKQNSKVAIYGSSVLNLQLLNNNWLVTWACLWRPLFYSSTLTFGISKDWRETRECVIRQIA